MSNQTQDLIRICELLPEEKLAEVADFARFLLAKEGDDQWEQLIATSQPRPRLEAFFRESAGEPATPLDPTSL